MYNAYQAASLHELSEFLAESKNEGGACLVDNSKKVFSHDFEWGFVRITGPIFAPLVLKTVFVFESYLKGRRSSFAIYYNCPRCGQGEKDRGWGLHETQSWRKCLGLNHNCPIRHFKRPQTADRMRQHTQPAICGISNLERQRQLKNVCHTM